VRRHSTCGGGGEQKWWGVWCVMCGQARRLARERPRAGGLGAARKEKKCASRPREKKQRAWGLLRTKTASYSLLDSFFPFVSYIAFLVFLLKATTGGRPITRGALVTTARGSQREGLDVVGSGSCWCTFFYNFPTREDEREARAHVSQLGIGRGARGGCGMVLAW
jgi:hypothetical protein